MTRLAVLMYHATRTVRGPLHALGVEPGLLREQLAYLSRTGAELTTLSEAWRRRSDSAKVVALTFDDAYCDFLDDALPAIVDLNARVTLYVPTAYVGKQAGWLGSQTAALAPVMDWSALRECVSSGAVEIGSHSHTHPEMDLIDADSAMREARHSAELLEQELSVPVRSFCYPHGYHSARTRRVVAQAGYETACEIGHRLRPPTRPYAISRLMVKPQTTPAALRHAVHTGGPNLEASAKRALQPGWRQLRRIRRGIGTRVVS